MDSSTFSSDLSQKPEPKDSNVPQMENPVLESTGDVQTKTVHIEQGGATSVTVDHIIVRQGGVVKAETKQFEMIQGVVLQAKTETAHLTTSNAGVLVARGEVDMDQSAARTLVASGNVTMNQSGAVVMVAQDVKADKSGVVFLFARKVEGSISPLFGPRESVLFGSVAGLVAGLVILASKQMKRRKPGR